jgi:transmembrane sensor
MNIIPNLTAADEAASLWAARLEGSVLSAADRSELEAWLSAHPGHRGLLSQYCQFSTDLELLLPALVATGGAELPAPATRRRRPMLGLAAGLALAAAAAVTTFLLWPGAAAVQHESIATPVAHRHALTLADGTQVELNAQTNLRVEITAENRHVRLASGQAFFSVTKDPARPFTVETPAGSVRVTGTQFDVRAETAGTLDVLVAEGSVQVRPADPGDGRSLAPVVLGAGEQLKAGPGGLRRSTLSAAELDDALAWRQGRIVFDGVPLNEALARFARYHGQGITASPGAANLRVGGRFSLDDLNGFLTTLEDILPVRVSRGLNGTVQVSLADAK